MLSVWARRLAQSGALLVVACVACGSQSATPGDDGTTGPVTAITGPTVHFDHQGALTAVPTAAITLGVTVDGADTALTLWLDGNYQDASLDVGGLTTKGGHGQLVLQMPSQPTTFNVHAQTAGGAQALLAVTAGSQGSATVTLVPTYAGKRTVSAVVGSMFLQTSCDELLQLPIQDAPMTTTTSLGMPLTISNIPAGTRVSISLRMANFARGCVDVDRLAPAAMMDLANVPLLDRTLTMAQVGLAASFAFEPFAADATAYSTLLDAAVVRAADAFLPSGMNQPATEAGTLIAAMSALVPSESRSSFDGTNWGPAVTTWITARPPSLRSRAVGWLTAAKAEASKPLTAELTAATGLMSAMDGLVTFLPLTWGAVGLGVEAGVSVQAPFTFSADVGDTVHFTGNVYFEPTALLTHAADTYAPRDVPQSIDVASAIATGLDCEGLATSLVGTGTSYPTCDAACTAKLCRAALASKWLLASQASGTAKDIVQIIIDASGAGGSDDNAELTEFQGSWVGKIISTTTSSEMKGSASANP